MLIYQNFSFKITKLYALIPQASKTTSKLDIQL